MDTESLLSQDAARGQHLCLSDIPSLEPPIRELEAEGLRNWL